MKCINISGKEFVRDIGFVIEAVKSTVYRDMDLAHPMSKIMEMLTKIDVDEKNSNISEVDLELLEKVSIPEEEPTPAWGYNDFS